MVEQFKQASKTAQLLLEDFINKGDITIDATCGNGHDTLFLSEMVGPSGQVFAIDIQKQAINQTKEYLEVSKASDNVTLIKGDHSCLIDLLPVDIQNKVSAIMFNLGYLPGSDHKVLTTSDSTLKAVKQAIGFLKNPGIITIICYPHLEGKKELEDLLEFCRSLTGELNAYEIKRINRNNPPELIMIVKG